MKTVYGYHIIKLLEKKPRESFSVMKLQIINYIKNGDHQPELVDAKIAKLRNEVKTETNKKGYSVLYELSKQ